MNIKYLKCIFLIVFSFAVLVFAQNEECTIGVAVGSATEDGRPMIWKTRDYASEPDNELVFNTSYDIDFLEVVNAGKTYAWMGLNELGFAILNTLAVDLEKGSSGYSNGSLMREALGTCATISDFIVFLDETNPIGRQTRGNFAVLDTTGAAAIFEIDKDSYWVFDANDSLTAPGGFIIRTNFAVNGDGVNGSGYERYDRSSDLINSFYLGDTLNYRSILRYQMRDFSDFDSEPVPVPFADEWISGRPYGYIYTDVSVCRSSSISATVIQGVLSGESEKLSTMWTILGQPAAGIAVPYWPVGQTPEEADGSSTAPLCDKARQIKAELFDYAENGHYIDSYKLRDESGNGLWKTTFFAEDSIFREAEEQMDVWRTSGPVVSEMLTLETTYAQYALSALEKAYTDLTTALVEESDSAPLSDFKLHQNYPNPFNPSTRINYELPITNYVKLAVYNILGQKVRTLVNWRQEAGKHSIPFNAAGLSSGLYYYKLETNSGYTQTRKCILLK